MPGQIESNLCFLSYPVDANTPVYGNGQGLQVDIITEIQKGDTANSQRWRLSNHLGTHVDAPYHFWENGKTITDFGPGFWVFHKVTVVMAEAGPGEIVKLDKISGEIPRETELLLIKSGFGSRRGTDEYWEKNPGLHHSLAVFLKQKSDHLRAVGVDMISISSWRNREEGRKAHKSFLEQFVLIEDMDFSYIERDTKLRRVTVAPLRISGSDAAPCTIIGEFEN